MTPFKMKHLRERHKLDRAAFGRLVYQTERAVRAWEQGERRIPEGLYELVLIKLNETELLQELRSSYGLGTSKTGREEQQTANG